MTPYPSEKSLADHVAEEVGEADWLALPSFLQDAFKVAVHALRLQQPHDARLDVVLDLVLDLPGPHLRPLGVGVQRRDVPEEK